MTLQSDPTALVKFYNKCHKSSSANSEYTEYEVHGGVWVRKFRNQYETERNLASPDWIRSNAVRNGTCQ